jgi:hypothetical protein
MEMQTVSGARAASPVSVLRSLQPVASSLLVDAGKRRGILHKYITTYNCREQCLVQRFRVSLLGQKNLLHMLIFYLFKIH